VRTKHPCVGFQSAVDGTCRYWVEPQPGARDRFEPFCARFQDQNCLSSGRPWRGWAENLSSIRLRWLRDRTRSGRPWRWGENRYAV